MYHGGLHSAVRFGLLVTVAAALVVLAAGMALSDESTRSSAPRRYDLTLDGSLKIQTASSDAPTAIAAWNRLTYDLTRAERSLTVSIHSTEVKLTEDGQQTFSIRMTRSGAVSRRGETSEEESDSKAQPKLQRVLRSFDTPVYLVAFDAAGKEIKRTRKIEGPTAQQFGDLADLILSVHAPFPVDSLRWESRAKMITAQGQTVAGTLTFEKVGFAPGAVRVKVVGRLGLVIQPPKADEVRVPSYTVTGEQIYDLATQEWRSARWSIEMAFDILRKGKPAGTASGMIKLAMNAVKGGQAERPSGARLPAPKRPPAIATEKGERAKSRVKE